jgi:uncharacterized protein involved in exopolysaccharide biosynthesis
LWKEAIGVVFKRKRLVVGLSLVVALALSIAVMSVPTSYEVAGKLVVTRSRGDLLISPLDERNFNFSVTAPTLQDMAVHAELLKNRSLVERVVTKLGLDAKKDDAMATAAPAASRLDAITDGILSGLTIQVVPNSNLVYVRYRSSNPVKGADIVNALLELYRETYLQVRGPAGVTPFFKEQRDEAAARLKQSEAHLTAFQERTALLAGAVQIDAYSRRLAEAEDAAVDAEYDLRADEQRAAFIKALLDQEPERIQISSTIQSNPTIQSIERQLLTLEMTKQQLLGLYEPTDRRVQDAQTEIDAQRRRLTEAQSQAWVPGSEVTVINARHRDLEAQYVEACLAAQKSRIRHEGAQAIAATMRDRERELSLAEVEREALMRDVEAGSGAYLLYRKKTEEARIAAALDDKKIANVAIGELASPQGPPVGPPENLALAFAVMVGLVAGVGGAFVRELFDASIKSEWELQAVDLPVLGSIPEDESGTRPRRPRARGSDGREIEG